MDAQAPVELLAETVLRHGSRRSDEAEIVVVRGESALTRFARSTIHQNVVERSLQLTLRLVSGGRVGVATTSQVHGDALRTLVEEAAAVAAMTPEDSDWPGVAPPSSDPVADAVAPATTACTPDERARLVAALCADLPSDALAFGGVLTSTSEHAVANSRGLFRRQDRTTAELRVSVRDGSRSGMAVGVSADVGELDPVELRGEALAALAPRAVLPLPPGEHRAVLAPYAVGRMLELLAFLAFSGSRQAEARTALRLGDSVAAPAVSICDDGHDPAGLRLGFDPEGTVKRRVDLVRAGLFADVVHDRRSARRARAKSTGHAVPPGLGEDPHAANLFMAAGDRSSAALVRDVERGVWIRHLHYVNVLDAANATITGVTRHGTSVLEDGRTAGAAPEMRFRVGIVDVLRQVEAVSTDRRLLLQVGYGSVCVPTIVVPAFRLEGPAEA